MPGYTGGFMEKVFSPYGSTILREEKNRRKKGLVWTLLKFKSVHYGGRVQKCTLWR